MNLARRRPWTNAFSTEALCTRIPECYRASIRVQKPRLAVVNLARIIDATLALSDKQGFHATGLRQLAEAWHVKRGMSIDGCIDGVGNFVSTALSSGSRISGYAPARLRSRPKPMAHP